MKIQILEGAIACWGWRGRDPLTTFSQGRAIALFDIKRSRALYNFFSGKGDRSFCIVPVDRPLLLFHARRAIALFGIVPIEIPLLLFHGRRAIALFASCR